MSSTNTLIREYLRLNAIAESDVTLLQVGQFYETYGQGADALAAVLRTAPLERNGKPMAGFARDQLNERLAELTASGHSVSVWDGSLERGYEFVTLLSSDYSLIYVSEQWPGSIVQTNDKELLVLFCFGDKIGEVELPESWEAAILNPMGANTAEEAKQIRNHTVSYVFAAVEDAYSGKLEGESLIRALGCSFIADLKAYGWSDEELRVLAHRWKECERASAKGEGLAVATSS